ncbi:hypothetical protein GRX03_02930 [Halovenus sp. WSH3]|uniref:Uncharacterized protein n=1 Tax=Halovenus carboxidivorans TaxID=2692199 RepID=A0A6B0T4V8_9EURY|nr:hypothetical protein [Halovenus carboxidivorans]MXR50563.1 hypothetical protein [Halovenus carboxidivorans]
MSQGILDLLGSMATLVFAIPLALAGAELLVRGDLPVGVGLISVAAAMLVVDRYVTTPGDIPAAVASKVAETVAEPPEEE